MVQITGFVPSSCYSWIVLPVVEEIQVDRVGVVKCYHGEMFIEVRDIATVECASWGGLSRADGVGSMDSGFREFGCESLRGGEKWECV